ncbi:MAG: PA2169 family four-helix-bundle protein [Pseudomonadota bacterium]
MSTPLHNDIHLLNSLIETTLDSADGYREAAKESDNPRFQSLFEQRSFERQQVAEDLRSTVTSLGGKAEDDGSILAKAHRAFLDIKHALLRDEQAVVNSVENGEDFIKAKFEKALEDSDVSPSTRDAIRRAYDSVRSGHDQMRDLKHSLEGQQDASNRLFPQ